MAASPYIQPIPHLREEPKTEEKETWWSGSQGCIENMRNQSVMQGKSHLLAFYSTEENEASQLFLIFFLNFNISYSNTSRTINLSKM